MILAILAPTPKSTSLPGAFCWKPSSRRRTCSATRINGFPCRISESRSCTATTWNASRCPIPPPRKPPRRSSMPSTPSPKSDKVKQMRGILAKWKDVGLQMMDLTSAVHALRVALRNNNNNEELLFRSAALAFFSALAFFYRSRLLEFCKARDISFEDIDPNPMLLGAIVADPSKFAEVKVMSTAFGILTDEALEKSVGEVFE